MVSCVQRAEVRAETLRQFHALGIHPHVLTDPCTDPTPAAVLRNAYVATAPHADSPTGVLFVEDDIDLNAATFERFVLMAVDAARITTLCLLRHRLLPDWVTQDAESLPASLVELRDYDVRFGFHGTMCVYLPQVVVERIRANPSEFMRSDGLPIQGADGFDFWLKMNARQFGGMFAAIPNPVNHRPGYSMWGNQERWQDFQSTTFRIGVDD